MKRSILGVVLCGGVSSRMGEDKALLSVRAGVTQLDHALALLAPFCDRRAAALGGADRPERDLPDGVLSLRDAKGFVGPMGGVVAGLRAAEGRPVLAIACDMPYLESNLVLQLVSRRNAERCASAFLAEDGLPDPTFAIYEPGCLSLLEDCGKRGRLSLRRFLHEVPLERIAPDRPQMLASINTPEELERARRDLS